MFKLERIDVIVKQVYPEQKVLICVDLKTKCDVFVISKSQFLYPNDKITFWGHYNQNKKWGIFFQASFYRESVTEFWLAKWLFLVRNYPKKFIVESIAYRKKCSSLSLDFGLIKWFRDSIQYLFEHGMDEECLAEIEQSFQYRIEELKKDPYLLLNHQVPLRIVSEWIRDFSIEVETLQKNLHILHRILSDALKSGHFYLPMNHVEEEFKKENLLIDILDFQAFHSDDRFIFSKNRLYLKESYELEQKIVQLIQSRLLSGSVFQLSNEQISNLITQWETKNQFSLAENQRKAVEMAIKEPFCVITGGPGVGKTTVCKCIIDILKTLFSIHVAAPTGRAAKRANESTGMLATTIHRKLEFNGYFFERNESFPIEEQVLITDESSMMDAELFYAELLATPITTKMIFCGDVDQLPSVGPGQILFDLIESNVIPYTRLSQIFRQAAGSPIIQCAYTVNQGTVPEFQPHDDLIAIELASESEVFDECLRIGNQLYKDFGSSDVQILIPTYQGPVGIDVVNRNLQSSLNPIGDFIKLNTGDVFRVNDKVIQTKNNYSKQIYNGDVGLIQSVSDQKIAVNFFGSHEPTFIAKEQLHELQLCYATSIHRSQGSEYLNVVVPLVESYGIMLQKNLLYTAITRAKKRLWIIYQPSALKMAVDPLRVRHRNTSLSEMLSELKILTA